MRGVSRSGSLILSAKPYKYREVLPSIASLIVEHTTTPRLAGIAFISYRQVRGT